MYIFANLKACKYSFLLHLILFGTVCLAQMFLAYQSAGFFYLLLNKWHKLHVENTQINLSNCYLFFMDSYPHLEVTRFIILYNWNTKRIDKCL